MSLVSTTSVLFSVDFLSNYTPSNCVPIFSLFFPSLLSLLELFYLFFTVALLTRCVFFPVGLSSLTRHFQQVLQFLLAPGWLFQLLSFEISFVAWSGLLIFGFKSLMRGEVCTLDHLPCNDITEPMTPHQWFELQDQQPRPSNNRNFETQQLK